MVTLGAPRRGDVYLVNLDPTLGGEIHKTRPRVAVSPDDPNTLLRTRIVATMTTGGHAYPFRAQCRFQRRDGYVVLDQIRTVDRDRLVRLLGRLAPATVDQALHVLVEMFAP